MGVVLAGRSKTQPRLSMNFWNWRATVEAIRSCQLLAEAKVDALHEQFVGNLSEDEAIRVAAAIRDSVLPKLGPRDRLLLSGETTSEPDDFEFHREPSEMHRNYGTSADILEKFAAFCEESGGFDVV